MSTTATPPAADPKSLGADPLRMTPLELRASGWLSSIFALRMLGLFLILPVFAVHAQSLPGGEDLFWVGLAMGIYGLTQGLLQIPFGLASDRFGRKRIIIFGLLIFAAGSAIAALAQTVEMVILGRAVQGAGAISAAVSAMIADSTRDAVRTKAMAMLGSMIGLTFALSLVLSPLLVSVIGVPGLFWLTTVLCFAGIAVMLWGVPDVPLVKEAIDTRITWRHVVLMPDLLRLDAGMFTLHVVQMALFVAVPIALVKHANLPLASHWQVYLPVVLLSFVAMVPPLLWAEKRGRLREVFLGAVALLLLTLLLLAQTHRTAWLLVSGLWLFFVAFNVLEAMIPSLVSRHAPAGRRGLAMGVYNTTQALGLFVGGAMGGKLAQSFGYGSMFGACAVLVAAWLIIAWRMQPPPARTAAVTPVTA
jgi:MFS family permease